MIAGKQYTNLCEIAQIMMGQSPSSNTYNESEGLPFFQGNADFGKVHPRVRMYCSAPIRIAEADDILISVRAPIGAINIADRECCIGRGLASIRGGKGIDRQFLFYCLIASKDKLVAQGTGSTFKAINKDVLANLKVPSILLQEQKRIVSELDLLTSIIDKQNAQLKELDILAKSIFYDMFGNPDTNEKGWAISTIGETCTITCGQDYKSVEDANGAYPIYGTGGIMGKAKQYRCPKESVIIGRKGNINSPIYVPVDFWNVDTAFGVTPHQNVLNPIYFYYFCIDYDFTKHDVSVTIPSLRRTDVLKIKLPVPPIHLQQSFAERIAAIKMQKEAINRSITDSQKLFDYTMDKYFG
jgi:type I restriction enzyme S subunit